MENSTRLGGTPGIHTVMGGVPCGGHYTNCLVNSNSLSKNKVISWYGDDTSDGNND